MYLKAVAFEYKGYASHLRDQLGYRSTDVSTLDAVEQAMSKSSGK